MTKDSILIVLVLYKCELQNSLSYHSLTQTIQHLSVPHHLLVFNNSPEIAVPPSDQYEVAHEATNVMLSGAYNHALQVAASAKDTWLLLLDQDTQLTESYFQTLSAFFQHQYDTNIVNVVPRLLGNGRVISPHRTQFFHSFRQPVLQFGEHDGHVIALNSVSLLSVDFMQSIGGFSSEFPLDMLDKWTSLQIFKQHKKYYVLDTTLEHHLSVLDTQQYMSESRYSRLLESEYHYFKKLGKIHVVLYKCRLIFRFIKQLLLFKSKAYAVLTCKHIFR